MILKLERIAMTSFIIPGLQVPFYYRYLDDLCAAVPAQEVDSFFECFNSVHPRLQFTLELEMIH